MKNKKKNNINSNKPICDTYTSKKRNSFSPYISHLLPFFFLLPFVLCLSFFLLFTFLTICNFFSSLCFSFLLFNLSKSFFQDLQLQHPNPSTPKLPRILDKNND